MELPNVKNFDTNNKTTLKLHCRDSSRIIMKIDVPDQQKENFKHRVYLLKIQETKNEYSDRHILLVRI